MKNEKKDLPNSNNISTKEDIENVIALGLYTPSQSIATAELRKDSLQNIIGILAHAKYPASRNDLLSCAKKRNAEKEVIDIIQAIADNSYTDLTMVIEAVTKKKISSTPLPK